MVRQRSCHAICKNMSCDQILSTGGIPENRWVNRKSDLLSSLRPLQLASGSTREQIYLHMYVHTRATLNKCQLVLVRAISLYNTYTYTTTHDHAVSNKNAPLLFNSQNTSKETKFSFNSTVALPDVQSEKSLLSLLQESMERQQGK